MTGGGGGRGEGEIHAMDVASSEMAGKMAGSVTTDNRTTYVNTTAPPISGEIFKIASLLVLLFIFAKTGLRVWSPARCVHMRWMASPTLVTEWAVVRRKSERKLR